MEEENRFRVPLFDGQNYDDWKFRMQVFLRKEDVLELAEKGIASLQEPLLDHEDDTDRVRRRKEEAREEVRRKDLKCINFIVSRVADSQLEYLKGTTTAKQAWDSLMVNFERATSISRGAVLKKYASLKYKPSSSSFRDYCMEFDKTLRELKQTGAVKSEVDVVFEFLFSMPSEYESIVSAIRTVEPSRLNLPFARLRIEEFEYGRPGPKRTVKASSESAFAARNSRSYPYSCHRCGGPNHMRKDCTTLEENIPRVMEAAARARGRGFQNSRGRGRGGPSHRGGSGSVSAGWTPQPQQQPMLRGAPAGRGRGFNRGGRGGGRPNNNKPTAMTADDVENDGNEEGYAYSFFCQEDSEVVVIESRLSDVSVEVAAMYVSEQQTSVNFILDSGASRHLVRPDVPVSGLTRLERPVIIQVAKSGAILEAWSKGFLAGRVKVNGTDMRIDMEVLVVDQLSHNLLSISTLDKKGYFIAFWDSQCLVYESDYLIAQGQRETNLYKLNVLVSSTPGEYSLLTEEEKLWHRRLGHPGNYSLKKVSRIADGIGILKCEGRDFCDICVQGKLVNRPFPGTRPRTTRVLQRIHSDVCGPIKPTAYNGVKYILTLLDDYSHYTIVFGLKKKSGVFNCLQSFVARVNAKFGQGISEFRCDNGTEFVNGKVKELFDKHGIRMETTIPGTPQNNGVAERLNRTLLEKARCMLFGSNLRKSFWIEAVLTAVYLLNRCPTRAIEEDVVPLQLWSGEKPKLSDLKVFGCVALVKVAKEDLEGKFEDRTVKCIMLGYCVNGYKFWDLEHKKIIYRRSAAFDEYRNRFDDEADWVYGVEGEQDLEIGEEEETSDEEGLNQEGQEVQNEVEAGEPQVEEFEEVTPHGVRQGARVRMRPQYLQDYVSMAMVAEFVDECNENVNIVNDYDGCEIDVNACDGCEIALSALNYCNNAPQSYSEIKGRPDEKEWYESVREELDSLIENNTWELSNLPEGKVPLNCMWVFAVKENGDGIIDRRKSRLVIKGCAQRPGIDFHETYAPVAKLTSVRIFLCLANQQNMTVFQLDVKNAFLNGDLKEEIYMWPPEGLALKDYSKVCKLKRTLYGLKQAPMEWNKKFDIAVKTLGFSQCKSDQCLYVYTKNGKKMYLLLYVDDFLLAGSDEVLLVETKSKIMSMFKMRDLGEVSYFLGIKVTRVNGGIFLCQENYIKKLLEKFGLPNIGVQNTPMETNPPRETRGETVIGSKPYRELIGSLMYACMATRPDICAAVNHFSQYQTNAGPEHWKGLKRILRYLNSTAKWGLWYKANSYSPLTLYVDADFANEPGRKSVSGFVVEMFGDSVTWATRKQQSVALSTTEAEYVALATGVRELLWLRQLLNELGVPDLNKPITVFEDNQACIHALKFWDMKRLKHVDIKYNFVKELNGEGVISVVFIPTAEQTADLFTKGLPLESFVRHRKGIGMTQL